MARQVECPSGLVFSPLEGACVSTGYECRVGVTTESVTEVPVTEFVPQNATTNVQVSSENEFQILSSVSMSSAVGVSSKHAVLFAVLIFVNINN